MLTKREAIELSLELWQWLAADINRDKMSWPRWSENGGTEEKVTCYCHACAYALTLLPDNEGNECKYCFIAEALGERDCFGSDSPFLEWFNNRNDPPARRRGADTMVKLLTEIATEYAELLRSQEETRRFNIAVEEHFYKR